MLTPTLNQQLPHGVADLFFNDAARRRAVERKLAETFARWGYSEIIPPSFEYYESQAAEAGPQLRDEMYRFFDRDGRTLALRPDFTIPTARVVGTKLYDRAMPLRFYYVGSVFRYTEPQAGVRREFTQAGIELVGAGTADADAEAIALAMTALQAIGLDDCRFTLGNAGYLLALTHDLDLDPGQDARLRDAIRRKNSVELTGILDSLRLDEPHQKALAQIPMLWGDGQVLDRAECVNAESREAVDRLRHILARLAEFGLERQVILDLAENRGMAYYTGVLFEGFVPGLGFSVASGGRYDDLISHFGPSTPAVGFAIGVERVVMALRARGGARATIAPDVVAAWSKDFQRVQEARVRGVIVEVDILQRNDAELVEYAQVRNAHEVWFSDGRTEVV